MDREAIARVRESVEGAERIVAFTGAGISAESGIPTYRGDGGVWTRYDPARFANIDFFLKDPTYYWSFFRDVRYPALASARPNPGHEALATLERTGRLRAVITQNIDGLHQEAGSRNVVELHGNTRVIGCLSCEADHDFHEVRRRIDDEMPPKCTRCGGMLKPRVVFFGEPLPEGAMERAAGLVRTCDLFLAVGSTLQVFPAASLAPLARRGGARLVIVNVGPTAMDDLADVRVDGKVGEVLAEVVGRDS